MRKITWAYFLLSSYLYVFSKLKKIIFFVPSNSLKFIHITLDNNANFFENKMFQKLQWPTIKDFFILPTLCIFKIVKFRQKCGHLDFRVQNF